MTGIRVDTVLHLAVPSCCRPVCARIQRGVRSMDGEVTGLVCQPARKGGAGVINPVYVGITFRRPPANDVTLVFAGAVAEALRLQLIEEADDRVVRLAKERPEEFTEQKHVFDRTSALVVSEVNERSIESLLRTARVESTRSVWLEAGALAVIFNLATGAMVSLTFPPAAIIGLITDIDHYFRDGIYVADDRVADYNS